MLLVAAVFVPKTTYLLQEVVVMLLAVTFVFAAIFIFLIALVLLHGGMRRALHWFRSGAAAWLSGLSHRYLGP